MPGIFVEIIGNASQFKRELDGAVRSTSKANTGFSRMGRAAKVAGLALGGALAVGLVHAAKGAMDDEVANERLAKSFENAHQPIGAFKDQIEKATDAAVKMGFKDETAAGALGTLVTATGDGKKGLDLMGEAMDVARFKGTGLEEGAKLLTSTLSGNVRSAKSLGIILLPVTSHMDALRAKYKELGEAIPPAEARTARFQDKQATAAQAIQKVNDKLHGQAAAFSDTAAGKIETYNAQMDQLSDNLGKTVLPALNFVLEKLNKLSAWMVDNPGLAKAAAEAIGVLSIALYGLGTAFAVAGGASLPFTAPILAAIIVIGGLSFVVYKLVTDFKKNWDLLLPIVLGPIGLIMLAVHRFKSQIAEAFTAAWNAVRRITIDAMNAVQRTIIGAIGAAGAAAKAVGQAILDGIMDKVRAIAGKARAAFSAVWAAIRGLVGLAASAGRAIGEAVTHGIIDGLTSLAGKAAGVIKSVIGHLPHISIPGFSPIEHVGRFMGETIMHGMAFGILNGGVKMRQALVGGIKDAKFAADDWIGSEGVDNMTEQGGILSTALSRGIAAHDLVAGMIASGVGHGAFGSGDTLGGSPLTSSTPLGASSLVNPPVVINVAGSVVTERQLIDVVQDGLNRKQRRNGSLGFT